MNLGWNGTLATSNKLVVLVVAVFVVAIVAAVLLAFSATRLYI